MYIEEICFNNHKILGNLALPLVSTHDIRNNKECTDNITINMSDDSKNRYTYIIGQNGAGKSTIFKTLINHIYGQMHPLNASVARALSSRAQMFEKAFEHKKASCGDGTFLAKNNNLRILHISNATTVISEGDFEEFMEIRPVLDNASLRMLPLIYKKSEKLDDLLSLLHHNEGKWSIKVSFANLLDTNIELESKGCMAILNGNDDINPLSFRNYIEAVLNGQTIEKHSIFERTLTKVSKVEIDSLCTSFTEICTIIKESHIYKMMCDYFANSSDSYSVQDSIEEGNRKMVFMPNMEGCDSWLNLEISELNDYDLVTIPVLVNMGILDFNILLDSVPINNMSSGEKVIIGLFSALAKFANQKAENILMLYDEPENSLHPEWQQLFPVLFRTIVENVYGITHSHFIFLTHSPLIIQRANDVANRETCSVLKLSRSGKQVTSVFIDDCHNYCVEELMLDHFNVGYRSKEYQSQIINFLNEQDVADPIDEAMSIADIKTSIINLYNEVVKSS